MLNHKEILRYMGASRETPALKEMIEQGEQAVKKASRPSHVFRKIPICVDASHGFVWLGQKKIKSASLSAHLNGCEEGFLFAFTLGAGVEQLIRRAELTQMSMVPVLQACAAEYTEFCADQAQKELEALAKKSGLYLRPRYSPGYGDFSLSSQTFFFESLEITKRIGVELTDSFLMLPFKSITAVIGLSRDPSLCHVGKCMTCGMVNCPFRKEMSNATEA